jgi:hypothetical protein
MALADSEDRVAPFADAGPEFAEHLRELVSATGGGFQLINKRANLGIGSTSLFLSRFDHRFPVPNGGQVRALPLPRLPLHRRHQPLRFGDRDNRCGGGRLGGLLPLGRSLPRCFAVAPFGVLDFVIGYLEARMRR